MRYGTKNRNRCQSKTPQQLDTVALHMELDRIEYNNNHKETRRHTTLDNGFDEKEWLASDKYNPINIIEAEAEAMRIRAAFAELTKTQRHLVSKMFIEGMSGKEYAESIGVSPAAVSQQLRTIRKKLKKLL